MKTFLYQGLARSLTATSPTISAALTVHDSAEPLPPSAVKRTPWHEAATFLNAAAVPLPDPRQVLRYPTAPSLPVRERRFHAEHVQVTSRDGITLPTLPAPQRAYTELTPPNPPIRRFFSWQQEACGSFPSAALPIIIRLFGGADANPVASRRIGACHTPAMTFTPPADLPVPTQVYDSCGPFVIRSKVRIIPESNEFIAFPRFGAPALYWSQASDPLPKSPIKSIVPHAESTRIHFRYQIGPVDFMPYEWVPTTKRATRGEATSFAGAPDKTPPFFGHDPGEMPVKAKRRTAIESGTASTPSTINERTYPGAWRFEFVMPVRAKAVSPWLAEVCSPAVSWVAPVVPPAPTSPCRFVNLVGTDSTTIALVGDGETARNIDLTGTDYTQINLGGEC